MSIRTKILGGFTIVVVLGALLGIIGVVSTQILTSDLEQFQHEAASFADILNAHNSWRNNLTESIVARKAFTGSLDPKTCALGVWLDSDEAKNVTDSKILSLLDQIQEPHDFIHNDAAMFRKWHKRGISTALMMHL